MNEARTHNRNRQRGGSVLIVAVATVLVISLLAIATTRMMVLRHQHHQIQRSQLQAIQLSHSAIERAIAQSNRDRKYQGETWSIDAKTLGKTSGASVLIVIGEVAGQPNQREITATTTLGAKPHVVVNTQKQLFINKTSSEPVR